MLKTSPFQTAEPLALLTDVVGNVDVSSNCGGNKMVKRSSPYGKLTIGATGYPTLNAMIFFT